MNINLSCPVNHTGYGIASLNILKELNKDNDIAYFPIGPVLVSNDEEQTLLTNLYQNGLNLDFNAPFIKIWHQFDLAQRIGRGKYFALSFFELDTFNKQEIIHLSIPDVLFVTSQWAKDIILKNNIQSTIEIVPLGVDRNIFNENCVPSLQNKNKYIFLNVGKWEIRKGHDILLELFLKAFPDEEDVELWICAAEHTNTYSSKSDLANWKGMYNHAKIKIISGVKSQQDLASLIQSSDCGIYPTRAEGWNMELLESMSVGKPVISINYSAQTEFCNKDNSYLVDIDELEPAYDGKAFRKQGNWAKIDKKQKEQIIEYMRFVYKNRISTNENGIKTAKNYSWTNSSSIIKRCINS
jgi:glycosyltransferase involved in cell wall biosynthesis